MKPSPGILNDATIIEAMRQRSVETAPPDVPAQTETPLEKQVEKSVIEKLMDALRGLKP